MRIISLIFTVLIFVSGYAQQPSDKHYTRFLQTLETVRDKNTFDTIINDINDSYFPWTEKKPETTRYLIVRHGESLGNREKILAGQTLDVDLTTDGIEEAISLGKRLAKEQQADHWSFDMAISSPAIRTKKTADAIISQLTIKPSPYALDFRIIEKHSGKFDGKQMDIAYHEMKNATEMKVESLPTFWHKFVYKYDCFDKEEESLQQVYDRSMSFFIETHSKAKGKMILVTTHSVVMKSLYMVDLALHHGVDMEYHRFELPNCSVLIFDVSDEGAAIVRVDGLKYRNVSKH